MNQNQNEESLKTIFESTQVKPFHGFQRTHNGYTDCETHHRWIAFEKGYGTARKQSEAEIEELKKCLSDIVLILNDSEYLINLYRQKLNIKVIDPDLIKSIKESRTKAKQLLESEGV